MNSGTIFDAPTAEQNVDNAITLRTGLSLRHHVNGTPNQAAMTIATDLDIRPFYIEQPLEYALKAFPATEEGLNSFIKLFLGVRCTLRDDRTRSFVVDGWTEELIRDKEFADENGVPFPMTSVFQEHYKLNVERRAIRVCKPFPDDQYDQCRLPAHRRFVNRDAYPLEALFVMPNQQAPMNRMSDEQQRLVQSKIDEMSKTRQEDLDRRLNEVLSSASTSRLLSGFGVTITRR